MSGLGPLIVPAAISPPVMWALWFPAFPFIWGCYCWYILRTSLGDRHWSLFALMSIAWCVSGVVLLPWAWRKGM
jgi:hypothetical protein